MQTLENGELFKEAAKLALGAKLEPTLAIRLLFRAGDWAAALALARRSDCFEESAELSRGGDTILHAFVVKAWTDALVATEQPLRAVQITDGWRTGRRFRWRSSPPAGELTNSLVLPDGGAPHDWYWGPGLIGRATPARAPCVVSFTSMVNGPQTRPSTGRSLCWRTVTITSSQEP